MRLYPGLGHTINADEITYARSLARKTWSLPKGLEPQIEIAHRLHR